MHVLIKMILIFVVLFVLGNSGCSGSNGEVEDTDPKAIVE